jgi:hypothetical protein
MIPEEAITADQDRKYVYVINDKDQIEHRQIKIGKIRNGLRAIIDGLKGDERVVVKGVQRVRPGVTVVAKLATPPTPPAGGKAGAKAPASENKAQAPPVEPKTSAKAPAAETKTQK